MKIKPLKPQLLKLERQLVSEALVHTKGDVRAAARALGVPERTMWNRINGPLGLDPAEFRDHRPWRVET